MRDGAAKKTPAPSFEGGRLALGASQLPALCKAAKRVPVGKLTCFLACSFLWGTSMARGSFAVSTRPWSEKPKVFGCQWPRGSSFSLDSAKVHGAAKLVALAFFSP